VKVRQQHDQCEGESDIPSVTSKESKEDEIKHRRMCLEIIESSALGSVPNRISHIGLGRTWKPQQPKVRVTYGRQNIHPNLKHLWINLEELFTVEDVGQVESIGFRA
jgi:hypothetical protein